MDGMITAESIVTSTDDVLRFEGVDLDVFLIWLREWDWSADPGTMGLKFKAIEGVKPNWRDETPAIGVGEFLGRRWRIPTADILRS